jgi:DNA polymerase-3 subunit gamma/tau
MGQALYRKYRSLSLDEIVGQEHVTQTLSYALKEGRISHAYLFTGPRGVGKTSIARILAHAINELPYDELSNHLDIIEIDAASNNGVEDIRDLREKVLLAPISAKYKVYIIDEVHMLSTAAFNALLKTLEEPPAHVIFILATTEVHKLPATIISRTQRFHFLPIDKEKVVAHLADIAQKERVEIKPEALTLIAEYGGGMMRDSVSLLDQLINTAAGKPATVEMVRTLLGLPPAQLMGQLVSGLVAYQPDIVIKAYSELLSKGVTAGVIAQQLIRALREVAPENIRLYSLIEALIDIPRAYDPEMKLEFTLAGFAATGTKEPAQPIKTHTPDKPATPKEARSQTHPKEKGASSPDNTALQVKTQPEESQEKDKVPVGEALTERPTPGSSHITELTPELWQIVINEVKVASPTLYTVMRQAIEHFDSEQQVLTLTFRFPLHQTRLEDQKYRKLLADIIVKVLGELPTIEVVLNRNAVRNIPPAVIENRSASDILPNDPATSTVLGIMGGGEIVDA